jgi:hypothetical protein
MELMATKRLIGYLAGTAIAVIGAVCMPLATLGSPYVYIFPIFLAIGLAFLVIWAATQGVGRGEGMGLKLFLKGMGLIAKGEHPVMLLCPNCGNKLLITANQIRDVMEITQNFLIPCYPFICPKCEQLIGLNQQMIEYTFENKLLRQELYGYYMERLPSELLEQFKKYCDEHPKYDFKRVF